MRLTATQYKRASFFVISCLAFWPLTVPSLNNKSLFVVIGFSLLLLQSPFYSRQIRERNIIKYVIIFLIFVFITMIYRGIGFQLFGGNMQGSAQYLSVFTPLLFFVFSQSVDIRNESLIKFLIFIFWGAVVFTIINSLISFGLLPSLPFLAANAENNQFLDLKQAVGKIRVGALSGLATNSFILVLLLRKRNEIGINEFIYFLIFAGIGALSGHRIVILTLVGILLCAIFFSNSSKKQKFILYRNIFLFILVAIIVFSFHQGLPEVVIRALSWIPGIESTSAEGTSEWRIKVWEIAWQHEVPQYLWIGKGLTYNSAARLHIWGDLQMYLWALKSINYHQGPLAILICFGLPALFFFSLFHLKIIQRIFHIKAKLLNSDSVSSQVIISTLISVYLTNLILFIFVYGDLNNYFIFLHTTAALLALSFNDLITDND